MITQFPPSRRDDVPVFYDPERRRWRFVRSWSVVIGLLLTLILVVLVVRILAAPALPGLQKLLLQDGEGAAAAELKDSPSPATHDRQHALNSARAELFREKQRSAFARQRQFVPTKSRPTAQALNIGYVVTWDPQSFMSLKEHAGQLNGVIVEALRLSSSGEIAEIDAPASRRILDWLRQTHPHIRRYVVMNNYDGQRWDSVVLQRILLNPPLRQSLVKALVDYAGQKALAGINIDFEDVPAVAMPAYYAFLAELQSGLHTTAMRLAVCAPLDNDSINYRRLATVADTLVLMAYDQHWSTSSPGAIAGLDWLEPRLAKRVSEIPAQQLIVAFAAHSYDWPCGRGGAARSLSWRDVVRLATRSRAEIRAHPRDANPTFGYLDSAGLRHEVWMQDAVTAFNTLALAKKCRAAGFALWRMGAEDPMLWSFFSPGFNCDQASARALEVVPVLDRVPEEADAEFMSVIEPARPGRRELTFEAKSQRITASSYSLLPSPGKSIRPPGNSQRLVLSFDDGPDPEWTPKVLEILRENDVKATFFIVGYRGDEHPELLERIVGEGHEIGSHTYTHPNIAEISQRQLEMELSATQRLLECVVSRRSILFRAPYGATEMSQHAAGSALPVDALTSLGYLVVGMKIDPKDFQRPGVDEIVSRCVQQAARNDGHVILLHDGGGDRSQTVAALPQIIQQLRQRQYEFTTVAGLLGKAPEQIMLSLPSEDRAQTLVTSMGFYLVRFAKSGVAWLFLLGTMLGSLRLLMIGGLALWEKRQAARRRFDASYAPSVAVIVPAYNEEKVILQTIESLLASDGPSFEIIVIDDGSSDRTFFKVVEAYGQTHPRVRTYKKPNGGKPSALDFGLACTEAEIVIAMDADTIFAKETIPLLIRHFQDPRVAAVAGNAKVGNRINLLTRWQALEYITSQNLDRRAFSALNCITVVPGAVGAWRRVLVQQLGGFTGETLAEDADLTIALRRLGCRIVNEDKAIALTEAPDTFGGFVKQRYRWMYGTLQAAWKHRKAMFRPQYGALGFFALPNLFLFQVFFPLISPLMDLVTVVAVAWAISREGMGMALADPASPLAAIVVYYLVFVLADFLSAILAFALEPAEDWTLLLWIYWQRFSYRQLMYFVALKSVLAMLRGAEVGWGKLERKATVTPKLGG